MSQTTAEAYVRNGGDPQKLTPRPQHVIRETVRTSDGRLYINGKLSPKPKRLSRDPYEGPWGLLWAVKDTLEKRRRGK